MVPRMEASDAERAAERAAAERDTRTSVDDRRTHGVVHTPLVLARDLVDRADRALRRHGMTEGLATDGLRVVDPACGPGIFLAAALTRGAQRLVGIDRDEAALKAARTALEGHLGDATLTLRTGDALEALEVHDGPLLVLGNPPWAGRSASRTPLLETLLDDFREPVRDERKLGVLSDIYVRFWRWAAECVRRRGGAVAFLTNSSFLDGPVHRGMRACLRRWFAELEVLDLGGSSLVARAERDENVFGVRPGVASTVAVAGEGGEAAVRYASLRGTVTEKLRALGDVTFAPVTSTAPAHLFVPTVGERFPEGWLGLDALFPFHREGVQTNRDDLVVGEADVLAGRLQAIALGLARADVEAASVASAHFDPERARRVVREALAADETGASALAAIAYRPFDERSFVTLTPLCHRPRQALLAAMRSSDGALLSVRKDRGDTAWRHVAWTTAIPDNCYLSSRSSCRTRAFPTHRPDGEPNLSSAAAAWQSELDGPLHLHALAVLASATYQARFDVVLHRDYPRIPPPDAGLLAAGQQLVACFLRDPDPDAPPARIGHRTVKAPPGWDAALAACDDAFRSATR